MHIRIRKCHEYYDVDDAARRVREATQQATYE